MHAPPTNKGKTFAPDPLTDEEVVLLARAADPRYPTGARNRALILAMARSGLRCAEALALRPHDYDAHHGTIHVRMPKATRRSKTPGRRKRQPRRVKVTGDMATALAKWLEHRAALGIGPDAPLFCSCGGARGGHETEAGLPLSGRYVRAMVARLGTRAGIAKRCHPHGLRHSFAHEAISVGVPINALSRALGHADSGVTATYIDSLGDLEVLDTFERLFHKPALAVERHRPAARKPAHKPAPVLEDAPPQVVPARGVAVPEAARRPAGRSGAAS